MLQLNNHMTKLFFVIVSGVPCLGNGLVAGPHQLADCKHVCVASGGGYFPVLIRLKNGDLMAVLRGGAPISE
jgi:hypothetical protein